MVKIKIKFVLLFCLLFLGIFSSLFSVLIPSVKGVHADQEFTFQAVEFFNYPNVPNWYEGRPGVGAIETYNTRLPTNITQHYNATYSFENDINGTVPNGWIKTGDGVVEVLNNYNEHDKVLNISGIGVDVVQLQNQFIDYDYGVIEFWIYNKGYTGGSGVISLYGGTTASELFFGGDGSITWRTFTGSYDSIGIFDLNVWNHFKFSLNTTGNRNNNLSIWVNEIQYLNEGETYFDTSYFDVLFFGMSTVSNYVIDAIGYSWDTNYSIGDNIVPYFLTENSTDTLLYEVDKNEFYYYDYSNPNFDTYANGDDNPSGWIDIENGQDNTNIYEKSATDNVVRMVGNGVTAEGTGLYQYFGQDYGNVNVTWNIDIIDVDNDFGIFRCNIHSRDGSLVVSIALLTNAVIGVVLSHFDGSSYNTLQTNLGLTNFTFKVFIDYSSDTFIFNWYEGSSFQDTYMLPLNINGKNGLGIVNYTMDVTASPPNNFEVDLDKVGVYVNGTSLVQDFAFVNFWNILSPENGHQHFTSDYSFIEILSESDDLGYAFFTAFVPYAPDDFPSIFERQLFIHNVTERRHLQDFEFLPGEKYIYGPGIRAFFTSRTEILNITYRTAILWDSVGNLRYTSQFDTSMDLTSYFYVSDSGSLLFNHYVKDDSLEFIQLTFDIVNTLVLNHTLVHDIFKSGISEAILRLNYSDDTSSLIYFQNYPVHGNLILPDKVLNQFIVLVSDNDLYDNANTTGSVDTLTLQYIPDWTINIVSVDLITVLIPLMVIIIVSVVFSQVLGKESIVPLLLIMSVLLFIVELLPFWLLFISITVFGGIIFTDKDEVS